MATLLGNAYVQIRPDMDGFEKEANRKISAAVKSAAKVAAVAAGAAAAAYGVKFLGDSIKAASDLNESINAVNVTFGKSAKGVLALGENAAKALGLSANEFNALAVRFSSFAKTISGPGGDVVGTLQDMTTRASDFASVMNLDVNEAAEMFQSGLAGETEPLRRFGIDMSAAAVEAHALAKGIFDGNGEMSEAQKVQARYSLLMKQTKKTAGDFANTSDQLANRQRIVAAEMENARAKIGKALLPVMEKLTAAVQQHVIPALERFGDWLANDGVDAVSSISRWLQDNWSWLKKVAIAVGVAYAAWKVYSATLAVINFASTVVAVGRQTAALIVNTTTLVANRVAWLASQAAYLVAAGATAVMTAAQWALNAALTANPIGLVVVAIGALVAGLVLLWKKNDGFRKAVTAVWAAIRKSIGAVIDWLKVWVPRVWNAVRDHIQTVSRVISTVVRTYFGLVRTYIETVVKVVRSVVTAAWNGIKVVTETTWKAIKAFIVDPIRSAKDRITELVSGLRSWLSEAWTKVKDRAGAAWTNIKDAILAPVQKIWTSIQSALGITKGGGIAKDGPLSKVVGVFGAVVSAVREKFKAIRDAVIRPIASAFRWLNDNLIGNLNDKVLSKFGNLSIPQLPIPDGYAEGGWVRGPGTGTSDSIMARLSNGEYVVRAKAAKANADILDRINNSGGRTVATDETSGRSTASRSPISAAMDFLASGVRKAVRGLISPVLGTLRSRFGGSVGGSLAIGTASTLVDGVLAWADKRDAEMAAMWHHPVAGGGMATGGINSYPGHTGMDFGGRAIGTAILAAHAGKVIRQNWWPNYGVSSLIDHGGGVQTLYAHMLRQFVEVGDMVRAGQKIGLLGYSGNVRPRGPGGAHLHFEVRKDGRIVDPRPFMAGKGVSFDSGGWLQPGWNATYNGTGKPEPVLTNEQWSKMQSGNEYHFHITEAPATTEQALLAAFRRAETLGALA